MIIHQSETRGKANHGWLNSNHTFSFAGYYNPERMNFGALRVLNDDSVAPGMGFGTHPHSDMEIVSIPLSGSLQHKDSEGNFGVIKKGEIQLMTAGTGVAHSEFNASNSEDVKFLQIWVIPKKFGVKPRYEQKEFDFKKNELTLVVSPDGRDGSVTINQDAFFTIANLKNNEVTYERKLEGNGVYIFVLRGEIEIDGQRFGTRDGVGLENFSSVNLKSSDAEVLMMEVPMRGVRL